MEAQTTDGGETLHPAVDLEEMRAQLDARMESILKLSQEEAKNQWGIGRLVQEILDHKLFAARDYKTADQFFKAELSQIPRSSLYAYAQTAKAFSEAEVQTHGTWKLRSLIAYDNAAHGGLRTGDPGEREIQVPAKDGTAVVKKFKDCRADEVLAALAHQKKSHAKPGKPAPKEPNPLAGALGKVSLRVKLVALGCAVAAVAVGTLLGSTRVGHALTWLGTLVGGAAFLTVARQLKDSRAEVFAWFASGQAKAFAKAAIARVAGLWPKLRRPALGGAVAVAAVALVGGGVEAYRHGRRQPTRQALAKVEPAELVPATAPVLAPAPAPAPAIVPVQEVVTPAPAMFPVKAEVKPAAVIAPVPESAPVMEAPAIAPVGATPARPKKAVRHAKARKPTQPPGRLDDRWKINGGDK